jgi:catechol 2,3-dioxygenase-like lactoylglutathione lyase family enzyme
MQAVDADPEELLVGAEDHFGGGNRLGFAARFDHAALALHRMTDAWPILAEALGARFIANGQQPGYSWLQLGFANGFTIETLHPEEIPEDVDPMAPSDERRPDHQGEFVRRFLDKRGPGVHHITFVVDDLDAAIASLADFGLTPGSENRDDPGWQEVLYAPHQAYGVMLQVAQTDGSNLVPQDPPEGFVELGFDHPVAGFGRVVHCVTELEPAVALFRDGLGGRITSTGASVEGNHWVELGWEGSGRLRLLEATSDELADFVGEHPGRVRHLYFNFDDPGAIPGARKVAEGRWVVGDDEHLGVRIVVSSSVR